MPTFEKVVDSTHNKNRRYSKDQNSNIKENIILKSTIMSDERIKEYWKMHEYKIFMKILVMRTAIGEVFDYALTLQ